MIRRLALQLCVAGTVLLAGCLPSRITTVTLYDRPDAFVRLETDPTAEAGGHTHPASLSPEQMAAVLGGLTFDEPWAKLPLYDDLRQPPHHPALTESEIALFAPLLSAALGKATPEELVTFYHSTPLSGGQREITSGGIFVDGEDLHLILGNYRSPTHYSADIGMPDTTDDRLTPLRALAPQRGRLGFTPQEALREDSRRGFATWFQADRREVIVHYKRVAPQASSRPSSPASPRP